MKNNLLYCPFDHSECQHTEKYPKDLDCCECKRYHLGIKETGELIEWPSRWKVIAIGFYILSGIIVGLGVIYIIAHWFLYLIIF